MEIFKKSLMILISLVSLAHGVEIDKERVINQRAASTGSLQQLVPPSSPYSTPARRSRSTGLLRMPSISENLIFESSTDSSPARSETASPLSLPSPSETSSHIPLPNQRQHDLVSYLKSLRKQYTEFNKIVIEAQRFVKNELENSKIRLSSKNKTNSFDIAVPQYQGIKQLSENFYIPFSDITTSLDTLIATQARATQSTQQDAQGEIRGLNYQAEHNLLELIRSLITVLSSCRQEAAIPRDFKQNDIHDTCQQIKSHIENLTDLLPKLN